MNKFVLTVAAITLTWTAGNSSAHAQNAVLAEMYGRGVHAYNNGNANDAYNYLSMAINGGLQDPRAYYFRGIAAEAAGRGYEAESDWQQGAELEARGKIQGSIGRALSRFQGARRLKLEEIRQKARLDYLALSAAKASQGSPPVVLGNGNAVPGVPRSVAVPPPAPPAAEENPFNDGLKAGEPKVVKEDALAGAEKDPFADESAPAAGDAAPGADPFGGGAPADDPFGTDAPAGADPFGGDAGMDDPFAS